MNVKSRAPRDINLADWTAERYTGSPPERDWLVNEIFPARAVSLLAAMGDTGKSMLMLDLALRVAGVRGPWPDDFIGTDQISEGTAVIITAEDDKHEIHRRIVRIRKGRSPLEEPSRLIVVSLPDAGGPLTFFRTENQRPEVTDEFRAVRDQLIALDDLKLVVIDPLQAVVTFNLHSDPAAAQL